LETKVYVGATAHDCGNLTAYNYIGSLAWPFMASFDDGNQNAARLSCVRAKDRVFMQKILNSLYFCHHSHLALYELSSILFTSPETLR
jgi:hypothetical protein